MFVTFNILSTVEGVELGSKRDNEQTCVNAHILFIAHNVRIMFQTSTNPNESNKKQYAIY
jgi:hypothetical protein